VKVRFIQYYLFHQFSASEKTTNVLKKITSLFQHCSFSVSVTLTVAYWVLLRTELEKPRNWHTHGINMILVFVEVIITDIPGIPKKFSF